MDWRRGGNRRPLDEWPQFLDRQLLDIDQDRGATALLLGAEMPPP
jgi:hypothetical protein